MNLKAGSGGTATRVLVTVFVVITLVIGGGVYLSVRDSQSKAQVTDAGQLVRDNSRKLNDVPNSKATFVEFLDFECEACGAAFPMIEQLRSQYGDRVNFVIRYFPIQSHFNAERSARAVEAAAQQDKLEPMYKKMYETQTQWAEQQVPADDVFRGFASDIGLDMAAYDKAYNDPATLDRINMDVADGQALGVQGTPTFFVNGEKLEPKGYQDFATALDNALAGNS